MTYAERTKAMLAGVAALPTNPRPLTREELGPPLTLEQAKALHIQGVLLETGWNVTLSAKLLAVTRRTLHRMIVRYELDPKRKREFERRTP